MASVHVQPREHCGRDSVVPSPYDRRRLDGCFRFYRDVLGLKVTWGEEADGSASGAAFETEPTTYRGWGIRAAHLRDPDGNLIEINELLPPEA